MGSTDNSLSSTRSPDPQDSTRPELLDSSRSRDTSSTDAESGEVEEREQCTRVASTESQSIRVSESSRRLDLTDLSPRRRSEDTAPTSESSTLTGLVRTPLKSSSRSSALTPLTTPSDATQESTGSA